MSTGRLLTLLNHMPREGAFFMLASEDREDEPETPRKRRATVAETAALFGFILPEEVTNDA